MSSIIDGYEMRIKIHPMSHRLNILRWAMCLALSVVIVTLLSQLVVEQKEPPRSTSVPHYASPPRADYSAAAGRIFGEAPASTKATLANDTSLELEGVLVADDPAHSIATLLIDGREVVLSVGDSLPDGEKLEQVNPTSATLLDGSTERQIQLQITGDPIAGFDVAYLAQGGPIRDSPITRVNLPVINISSGRTESVSSRMAGLRSQALRAMMQKARSAAPHASTAHKPN